jgi:hypothetical protein
LSYSVAWQAGTKRSASDRMELPKHLDDEGERLVFRQVEAVTALRFVPACHHEKMKVLHHDGIVTIKKHKGHLG